MDMKEYAERANAMSPRLFKTAMMYLGDEIRARDAADEAVYKGLRACKGLKQPDYFDTWLTRILINVCHDELRRRSRETPVDELPEQSAESFDALPLKEAVAKLPTELREIIILRYFSGFTLKETAGLLALPQGTAATRQRRALELLRLELLEEDQNEQK